MKVEREGKWIAVVRDHGLGVVGENKLPAVGLDLEMKHELVENEWQETDPLEISYNVFLVGKAGQILERNIDRLKKIFGWNGVDAAEFQSDKFVGVELQLATKEDTYNGKSRIVVDWIDHRDSTGPAGFAKSDDSTAKQIASQLAPRLRAIGGGVPVKSSAPKPAKPVGATEDQAWEKFSAEVTDNTEAEWHRIIKVMFKRPQDKLTAEDWAKFIAEFKTYLAPF